MWRTGSLEITLMLGKLKGGGKGDDKRWDDWMASLTEWIWVWATSGCWWRTGKPSMLQSMGLQSIRSNLTTEQQNSWIGEKLKIWLILMEIWKVLNDSCLKIPPHITTSLSFSSPNIVRLWCWLTNLWIFLLVFLKTHCFCDVKDHYHVGGWNAHHNRS